MWHSCLAEVNSYAYCFVENNVLENNVMLNTPAKSPAQRQDPQCKHPYQKLAFYP